MLYAIGIGAVVLATFWLWGIRKMFRMNNDPTQLRLVQLLASAGNGKDEELLAFIFERSWTNSQLMDRVAHALTLTETLFRPDEHLRAKNYAPSLEDRYRRYRDSQREPKNHQSKMANGEGDRGSAQSTETDAVRTSATPEHSPVESVPASTRRQRFEVGEFVVYPAHGVGQILALEEQEIAGANLELFVISFMRDKMTLRVPTAKVANVGMRKLSDRRAIQEAYRTLSQPPLVPQGEWSSRAQAYEAKINSGNIIDIAGVIRDLFGPLKEHTYGERQLYEAALDRLVREASIVQHITEEEVAKECESLLLPAPF
jgi:CarD family transcriptional regulator